MNQVLCSLASHASRAAVGVQGAMFKTMMRVNGTAPLFDDPPASGGTGGTPMDIGSIVTGSAGASSLGDVETKVQGIGNGAYRIAFMVAIFVFVIGLVIAGIQVFFSNAANRAEQKSNLIWKVIGVIVAMGAVAIIIFLATASTGIFG